MSSFCAILDANVLFSASIRDILLRLASANLYRLSLTDEILEEACRNLLKTGRMTESGVYRLADIIKETFPEAFVTGYQPLISSMTNQVKDRHVLAAAVKAGAQVIVTKNLKYFLPRSLAPFDIEAQSPDKFLVHLHHFDCEAVVRNLIEQASDLRKPPMTVHELLDIIAQHAPTFVELIRAQFNSTDYFWSDIQR